MISISVLIIPVAAVVIFKKRRKMKKKYGFKSYITPICLFCNGIVALCAYLFHFPGVLSWGILIALLMVSAYYTKYLPNYPKEM